MAKVTIILSILSLILTQLHTKLVLGCSGKKDESNATAENVMAHYLHKRSPTEAPAAWNNRAWQLFINELDMNTHKTNSQFLELKVVRQHGRRGAEPKKPLENFFILILRAASPAVVFYVDLGELSLGNTRPEFIVIGDVSVPKVDVLLTATAIQSSLTDKKFPKGEDSPYAILLVNGQGQRRLLNQLKLIKHVSTNKFTDRVITTDLLEQLKPYVIDLVIFGEKIAASSCSIFDLLWHEKFRPDKESSYILRDWPATRRTDFSLNKCSPMDIPFSTPTFKYCKPTPGEKNDCPNGFSFRLENIIDLISPMQINDAPQQEGCSTDFPNVPAGRYESIDEARVENVMAEIHESVTKSPVPISSGTSVAETLSAIGSCRAEIDSLRGTTNPTSEVSQPKFKANWVELAASHLPNKAALLTESKYQEWVRILQPRTPAAPLAFYCEQCLEFYDLQNTDDSIRNRLGTKGGSYRTTARNNADMLTKHMEDQVHLLAMKHSAELQLAASQKERNDLRAAAKQQFNSLHEPTARMVRTVLTEVITEMPFADHKQIVDLQVENGISMGMLYRSRYGAQKIVEVVSATMHKNLLQYLKDQDKPFSLIVDATTNTQNIPYLVCFLMSIEDNQPISYFYKLLELSEGEGSRATFATFMNQVNADNEVVPGFKNFFKTRLRYLSSDSASVMVGIKQSFLTELKAELRRDVANIGCYAHKLSLVLKAALRDPKDDEIKIVTNFEKNLNDLYVFYQARGSKRFQHLAATAVEFDIKPVRFKQNHLVRWAAAEERVVDAILRNRDITVKDLEMIAGDKTEYPAPTRQKAQSLYDYLTDTSLAILLREFADLLSINKALSLTLQERAGTLFDHATSIQATLEQYRLLKDNYGTNVGNFLKDCECATVCQKPTCTMVQVEDCPSPVVCNGAKYERKVLTSEKIHAIRTHLYDKIVVAMNHYFNFELIEAIQIFDNRRYVTQKSTITSAKMDASFALVCKFMKHSESNCKLLQHDFRDLYRQLTESVNAMNEINNAPSIFGPFVLESLDVKVPQKLRSFFEELLVLPDSSAEAERGFSVFTRLQRGARGILSPAITDAIMRIRINAAKPLADLKVYEYTTELLKVMGPERTQPAEKSKKRSVKYSRLFYS